jgi:hypothetical protein
MAINMDTRGKRILSHGLPCLLILIFGFCKDPFEADVKFKERNFLVVEGYINLGPGVTRIKLSRTGPLNEAEILRVETGATISIENSNNQLFQLFEQETGTYTTDSLDLPVTDMYRIVISTSDEEQYVSEFVAGMQTPEIDSVTYRQAFEGVTIYVSTYDPTNSVQYYQWDYDETWEILSFYRSSVKYEHPNIIPRTPDEMESIYRCWRYETNPNMLIASTEKLSESTIKSKPLLLIRDFISDRLSVRYSILVKQHALSEKEYEFLQIIRKNSSDLGTFFDAQPTQVFGNILAQSSNKQVIGFIGAYTTASKQLFIINNDTLNWQYFQRCEKTQIPMDSLRYYASGYTPTNIWAVGSDAEFQILGAYSAPHACVDCHERGGNNVRPPFWPTNLVN